MTRSMRRSRRTLKRSRPFHAFPGLLWYTFGMTKTADKLDVTPIALTDEVAAMTDYVRSPGGRAAIERGLSDIRQGRVIEGKDALAVELKKRAATRRRA